MMISWKNIQLIFKVAFSGCELTISKKKKPIMNTGVRLFSLKRHGMELIMDLCVYVDIR